MDYIKEVDRLYNEITTNTTVWLKTAASYQESLGELALIIVNEAHEKVEESYQEWKEFIDEHKEQLEKEKS